MAEASKREKREKRQAGARRTRETAVLRPGPQCPSRLPAWPRAGFVLGSKTADSVTFGDNIRRK